MKPGRKKNAKPAPFITINDQEVSWPFIMRVHIALGKEWDTTIDAFWKARNAVGINAICRYINAGLKPDKNGKRFIMTMSKEREFGKMESVRRWWAMLYTPVKQREAAESQKAAIDDMLKSIGDKLGMDFV
jgi:hypothetical protein